MATSRSNKSELDGIKEEIKALIHENKLLFAAAMEESKSQNDPTVDATAKTENDSMCVEEKAEARTVEEKKELEPFTKEKTSRKKHQHIFANKSNGSSAKIASAKKRKQKSSKSYFSRASKIVTKTFSWRQNEATSSPPLALAPTFDNESQSEGEEHIGNSIRDSDFSHMSVPNIAAMMEEEQQKQLGALELVESVNEVIYQDETTSLTANAKSTVRKSIKYWEEAEKASSSRSIVCQDPLGDGRKTPPEDSMATPPPSPVRKSIQLWEKKHELSLSPRSNLAVPDAPPPSSTGHLTSSQLLLFENHSHDRAPGPIDLGELYDHEERKKEQTETTMTTDVTTSYVESSKSLPSLSVSLVSERRSLRRSLMRRPSKVHGDFAKFKSTMLVAMICVVAGIGTVGFYLESSRYFSNEIPATGTNASIIEDESPEPSKKANIQQQRDQIWDEMLATLL